MPRAPRPPRPSRRRLPQGIPLRTLAPNAVTALALCFGLTGVRFAIAADWSMAVTMILVAAVLDGIDGRIARFMRGESRFGAELDSLSDAISFGVAPALILYLWSLVTVPRFGWIVAILHAVFCALRLARFNAQIDLAEQPHKSAGFLTGVPAPAGAGLALLPLFLWLWSDQSWEWVRSPWLVAPWMAFVAFLMISSLATFSWSSLKLRQNIRFEAIAFVVVLAAALVSAPWPTLAALILAYLATIPFSILAYSRVRRPRAAAPVPRPAAAPAPPAAAPEPDSREP